MKEENNKTRKGMSTRRRPSSSLGREAYLIDSITVYQSFLFMSHTHCLQGWSSLVELLRVWRRVPPVVRPWRSPRLKGI